MDRVERLGVVIWGLGADPLSLVGLVAPVIGSGAPTQLSLSMGAGVVTLVVGVTGSIDCPFNWLKGV